MYLTITFFLLGISHWCFAQVPVRSQRERSFDQAVKAQISEAATHEQNRRLLSENFAEFKSQNRLENFRVKAGLQMVSVVDAPDRIWYPVRNGRMLTAEAIQDGNPCHLRIYQFVGERMINDGNHNLILENLIEGTCVTRGLPHRTIDLRYSLKKEDLLHSDDLREVEHFLGNDRYLQIQRQAILKVRQNDSGREISRSNVSANHTPGHQPSSVRN